MGVTSQVIGVPLLASASAAAGSAAGGAIAIALGVCDPKFGCTFGLQFGAESQRFLALARLARDVEAGQFGEQLPEARPRRRLVVHDEYAGGVAHGRPPGRPAGASARAHR